MFDTNTNKCVGSLTADGRLRILLDSRFDVAPKQNENGRETNISQILRCSPRRMSKVLPYTLRSCAKGLSRHFRSGQIKFGRTLRGRLGPRRLSCLQTRLALTSSFIQLSQNQYSPWTQISISAQRYRRGVLMFEMSFYPRPFCHSCHVCRLLLFDDQDLVEEIRTSSH